MTSNAHTKPVQSLENTEISLLKFLVLFLATFMTVVSLVMLGMKSIHAWDYGYQNPVMVFGGTLFVGGGLLLAFRALPSHETSTFAQKVVSFIVRILLFSWLIAVVCLILPWIFDGREYLEQNLQRFEKHLTAAPVKDSPTLAVENAFRHAQIDQRLNFNIVKSSDSSYNTLDIAVPRANYIDCRRFVDSDGVEAGHGVRYVLTQVNGQPPSQASCLIGYTHDLRFQRQIAKPQ